MSQWTSSSSPTQIAIVTRLSLSAVEGSHSNDGLLLGRLLDEPDEVIADKSLLEILDGMVMMYSLSVHQQLGKVTVSLHPSTCPHLFRTPCSISAVFQMVVVSDDVHEYAVALKDTEDKIARCPSRVSLHGSLVLLVSSCLSALSPDL